MPSLRHAPRFFSALLLCFLAFAPTALAVRTIAKPPVARGWTIEPLGSIGRETTTLAFAVNNRGEIVGYSYTDPDAFGATSIYGFVWDAGDRKSTRLNSSHQRISRMPSSA